MFVFRDLVKANLGKQEHSKQPTIARVGCLHLLIQDGKNEHNKGFRLTAGAVHVPSWEQCLSYLSELTVLPCSEFGTFKASFLARDMAL